MPRGSAEEPRALDLLATHLVDTQIAIDFFNDPERMNRDLLSDAARDYLPSTSFLRCRSQLPGHPLLFDKPE